MKRLILVVSLMFCMTAIADGTFNFYGVWHPVESVTLSAGERTSSGVISFMGREKYYNFLIYGVASDSIYPQLDVYGMMTYNIADTSKAVLIGTTSEYTSGSTVSYADSLIDNEAYPFVWIRLTNNHPDSSAVFDVWGYAKPAEQTIIRNR